MALSFSFPPPPLFSIPTITSAPKPSPALVYAKHSLNISKTPFHPRRNFTIIPKSAKEEDNAAGEATPNAETPPQGEMGRKEETETGTGLVSEVVEEIGKIDWPEFGKVVGTTGVVLGVIAGSSVVLLTVNVILAEISDKVFAGKGIQDFFG